MQNFYKTKLGRMFVDRHIPELIKALNGFSDEMKKSNKIEEKKLKLEEKKIILERKNLLEKKNKLIESNKVIRETNTD
jgi:hypothetical protein